MLKLGENAYSKDSARTLSALPNIERSIMYKIIL